MSVGYHYYAFGLGMEGEWSDASASTSTTTKNRRLYNGKELSPELGLYDYGARWYDPATAIWTAVDPLASEMPAWSPYNYTFGNPTNFTDPTGMLPSGLTEEDYTFGFAKVVQGSLEELYAPNEQADNQNPDDIIYRVQQEDGSYRELARIKDNSVDITFDIDYETAKKLSLTEVPSLAPIRARHLNGRLVNIQAASIDISGEAAAKWGLQVELSLIGMIRGPDRGNWGIALQGNGLVGLEGSASLSITFYAGSDGRDLRLSDLSGLESGIQGSIAGINGAIIEGYAKTNRFPFLEVTYRGFSYGGSMSVTGLPIGSGSAYIGASAFLYRRRR